MLFIYQIPIIIYLMNVTLGSMEKAPKAIIDSQEAQQK